MKKKICTWILNKINEVFRNKQNITTLILLIKYDIKQSYCSKTIKIISLYVLKLKIVFFVQLKKLFE